VFLRRRGQGEDDFYTKAIEGFTMFASTRARSARAPLERCFRRDWSKKASSSRPSHASRGSSSATRWTPTRRWAAEQPGPDDTIRHYPSSTDEGAKVLTGGAPAELPGDLSGGYFIQPTVFEGDQRT